MNKIRFGIIGTNTISDKMIEGALRDSRFEAAAVCSRSQETGREFATRHRIPQVFISVKEMASSPNLDAIYVASPNALHCAQAIICMEHGKHVLCEKPMASNAEEASRMIASARKGNVVLMEAVIPTLSPCFQAVLMNLPRIGKIRRYFASYCQYSSRYDALKKGIVANAFKPELSNGAVMDIGVYCIYPMVALFGMPENIMASAMKLSTGVDGQGSAICSYPDFDAVIMYSKIADSALPAEIQGEEGTLTIDRINTPRSVVFTPRDKSLSVEDLTPETTESPYYYEIKEFIDLIESGRKESERNSLASSLNSIKVIDEIRRQSGIIFPADKIEN